MNKSLIASGVALAIGLPTAHAELVPDLGPNQTTDSGNFTILNHDAGTVGGTNDVTINWDGTGFNASSDYTGIGSISNITMSTTTLFFNHNWTAHDIQVFVPGSYSFDTALGGGNPESGILNVTVPGGHIGMHMLFDWGGNLNIDVFVVAAPSSVFGSGIGRGAQTTYSGSNLCDIGAIANCLYDGKAFGSDGKPAGDKVWMLATVDGNGDGIMGIPFASGGPFAGFNPGFNMDLAGIPFIPPGFVTIHIPGGNTQECSTTGGSDVPMDAQITISDDDAVDTVSWSLDGAPASGDESVVLSAPLGTHTAEVVVSTVLGHTLTDTASISIEDTIPPVISATFINSKTGAEVTEISSKDRADVSINVSDVCDDSPGSSATAGLPVFDGNRISARISKNDSSVKLGIDGNVDNIEVTVAAEDASGNMSNAKTSLIVTP